MFTFLDHLWTIANHPRLKRRERRKQEAGGYEVEIPSDSRGEFAIYREGDKWLDVFIDISRQGVRLYTQSLRKWQAPMNQELSQVEYDLVLKRVCEYLSIEGEVTLDHSPLMTREENLARMKSILESEGWELK